MRIAIKFSKDFVTLCEQESLSELGDLCEIDDFTQRRNARKAKPIKFSRTLQLFFEQVSLGELGDLSEIDDFTQRHNARKGKRE